ncbi:MAG TPA: ATP-binding protein [Rhodanobacteraceae bacterium]|nr:ATP-binding protein [Rhodanobacteraceae bacterium]
MRSFSLRLRLTLLLALAALVALGIAAWIVDWRADAEMQQRFDSALLARAQAFAALVHLRHGTTIAIASGSLDSGLFPAITGASWYDLRCNGISVAHSSPSPPAMASTTVPGFADTRLADGRLLREVLLRFMPRGAERLTDVRPASVAMTCELRYALDRGPLDGILGTLDLILLGSILGACLVVLALTPWLVRRGLRPLSTLDAAMAGIGPDAPGERLPRSDTRELAPLVARFNEVLARMDEGLARERQFAAGLAHELRTRLAELRTLIDVETRYPSERDTRSVLDEVGKIGGELEATVTALLQLTRIESGVQAAQREAVDVQALVTRVLARHHEALHAHGLRLERDAAQIPTRIETDPALLEIVLDNLIGNAIAYAPPGSAITVRDTPQRIGIGNAAPGLGEEDLRRFGQRFWRKRAGEDGAGHAGLGLALAQAAARALEMRLEFALESGQLRARLHW